MLKGTVSSPTAADVTGVVPLESVLRQRQYQPKDYATPYQKLKSLPGAQDYLKDGISLESLERMAKSMSDTEFAGKMRATKTKLLRGCKIESPLPPPQFL